jgi:hypothetical protein
MTLDRPIKLRDYRSSEPDPSREVDLIMDDLEIVLRCQCCVRTSAAFRIEAWDSDLASAQETSVGEPAETTLNMGINDDR